MGKKEKLSEKNLSELLKMSDEDKKYSDFFYMICPDKECAKVFDNPYYCIYCRDERTVRMSFCLFCIRPNYLNNREIWIRKECPTEGCNMSIAYSRMVDSSKEFKLIHREDYEMHFGKIEE